MADVAPSSARRRGSLSAFRQPFVTDPVFWIAVVLSLVIGVLVGGALYALSGAQSSFLGLAVPAIGAVVALSLAFKLLAMGMNTGRALEDAQVVDEERATALESKGRTAGAAVGRGAAALLNNRKKPAASPAAPPPTPTEPSPAAERAAGPTSAPEAKPEVTVDKAARVIGSMVGRRLAERRKDDS